MKRSRWIALVAAALAVALTTAGSAVGASQHGSGYAVQALVSDQPGVAPTTDPNLVNGWGISAGPTTPWWVSNEGTDTSTLYDAAGTRGGENLLAEGEEMPTAEELAAQFEQFLAEQGGTED